MSYVSDLPVRSLVAPNQWEIMPDLLRSDHFPFWKRSYPALMLTDTSNFRYPHYHSADDQIDQLDFYFMARVLQAALASVFSI